jgi:hypothetical protein
MSEVTKMFSCAPKTGHEERFEHEVAAYEALWPQLRRTHLGQWVAIKDGQVVDSDRDKAALIRRVYARWPQETVYFEQVLPDYPHRTVDIPGIDTP